MSKNVPQCVICGAAPTVRSHLLPQSFIRAMRGTDKHVLLSDRERYRSIPTQAGTFDDSIFCTLHERVTGELDRQAVGFTRTLYEETKLESGNTFSVSGHSAEGIMRFACSILLRCHLSSRDEARHVDLGPYAGGMQRLVFDGDLSAPPHLYVYAAISQEIDYRETAGIPASARIDGFRRWSFNVGGVAYVVDLGRAKPAIPEFLVRMGEPIRGPVFAFDDTPLASAWRSLVARPGNQTRRG